MLGLVAGRCRSRLEPPDLHRVAGHRRHGHGPASLSFILAVQHAVSWGQRGVATGAVIFFRTIGGAIGVGILGGALGWELGHLLVASGATGIDVRRTCGRRPHQLLSPENLAAGPGQARHLAARRLHPDAPARGRHAGVHRLAAGQVGRVGLPAPLPADPDGAEPELALSAMEP